MKFRRENLACVRGVRNEHDLPSFQRFFSSFFFHTSFARVSPVFAVALLAAYSASFTPNAAASNSSADPTATVKRQSASTQFLRAQDQRAALSNKSPEKRTLEDYKQVVNTYRRVYLI